ncbi:MAG: HDIG domain-containing protein [Bacteroides sp.]|nr:HDIG domain-containing protein [Bacteroides sp.]MBD5418590.1 HDIG domain-containing protein [Bacteroides sp.]
MKKFFNKLNIIRIAMLLGATIIIMLIMPRADHQSFSYELNQPWKYPLLTAEFDTPILRDSASINRMRDSIEADFIPFAIRRNDIAAENIRRFSTSQHAEITPAEKNILTSLLNNVYQQGIAEKGLYTKIHTGNNTKIRTLSEERKDVPPVIRTQEGNSLLTSKQAFDYVDSAYSAATGIKRGEMKASLARSLTAVIAPDVLLDSVNDTKYRNQELLNVSGALGVIKKGQRIVDRGEIINRQIFTNLNTYQELLQSKRAETTTNYYFYLGQGLYILICWLILYIFLAIYRKEFYANLRKMTFLVCYITFFTVVAALVLEWNPTALSLIPFAAVPVIVMVFFDSRTAIFSLLVCVLMMGLIATYQFQFVFLELTAGLAATFSINHLSKRSQLLRTAIVTLAVYCLAYTALTIATDGNLDNFSPRLILFFFFNSLILSFAYILVLIVEKCFGFTSMVTLVELSDINNPLLRRLAEEAPGTFQHSMQVSTLAAEAARAIGANTQLVRTGALYHDIGKLESPIFFTENQHGINPHAGLNPETSAHKIISHVTNGLTLASKAKLPQVIKDFISQHHGKGLAKYFYNTAVNNAPEGEEVDPTLFQYPGPNPQSKETAILMMADSVEAASRSLKDYTRESIDNLVNKIIDTQIADGLFKESPLSFADVETIKDTFKKRLATIYHTRIAYPTINK